MSFFKLNQKTIRAFHRANLARLSKLPSTYVNNSLFWGEWKFPKDKGFFKTFPNFRKTSGTFVKTAFCLYKWLFRSDSNYSQNFFYHYQSKSRKFWDFREVFSAMLSKLVFASSVQHSDVFFEQFSLVTPFRYLSKK